MWRTDIVMHSPLSPTEAMKALRESVDEERWGFSLSGYGGDLPVLGIFGPTKFRLRKRIFYHNGYARMLYGRFVAESGGTRVEAYLDSTLFPKLFSGLWLGIVSLVCLLTLIRHAAEFFSAALFAGKQWIGLLAPFGMLAIGFLFVQFGRLLSKGSERFLVEHLEETLKAEIEEM